ncbi:MULTISPECIES: hypothetical protein [Rhodococcus]|uniref:hypothetical protein n=1 Tax=Rhodococcus TaxID=1827 RepID=UPI0022CD97D2|nr:MULTISPECIES: hypothetical protein [Rhodococcus]MCZ9629561.1 hypothetical protein [Rhodococcus sp. BH5]MEA1796608.1 hypothetical protein [Rhodococcus qingshengii]
MRATTEENTPQHGHHEETRTTTTIEDQLLEILTRLTPDADDPDVIAWSRIRRELPEAAGYWAAVSASVALAGAGEVVALKDRRQDLPPATRPARYPECRTPTDEGRLMTSSTVEPDEIRPADLGHSPIGRSDRPRLDRRGIPPRRFRQARSRSRSYRRPQQHQQGAFLMTTRSVPNSDIAHVAPRLIVDTPAGPAPADLVAAAGHLEAELAKTTGFIHTSAGVTAAASAASLIVPSGSTLRTPLGHTWVFDCGCVDCLGKARAVTFRPFTTTPPAPTRVWLSVASSVPASPPPTDRTSAMGKLRLRDITPEEKQRFAICAHEAGHAITARCSATPCGTVPLTPDDPKIVGRCTLDAAQSKAINSARIAYARPYAEAYWRHGGPPTSSMLRRVLTASGREDEKVVRGFGDTRPEDFPRLISSC